MPANLGLAVFRGLAAGAMRSVHARFSLPMGVIGRRSALNWRYEVLKLFRAGHEEAMAARITASARTALPAQRSQFGLQAVWRVSAGGGLMVADESLRTLGTPRPAG